MNTHKLNLDKGAAVSAPPQRDTPSPRTIAEKLDQQFPASCLICETPMRRSGQDWPICLKCGLDQTGAEAYQIAKHKTPPVSPAATDYSKP